MKEHGILFKGEMVRAILEGRKTQTRREAKPQPSETVYVQPNYKVGDHLYVKETWRCRGGDEYLYQKHRPSIVYKESAEIIDAVSSSWKPSIFMPKWAARIWLEVTEVRGQNLWDISYEDALEEGIKPDGYKCECDVCQTQSMLCPVSQSLITDDYFTLWGSINGRDSFLKNPWVWAYTFKRIEKGRK